MEDIPLISNTQGSNLKGEQLNIAAILGHAGRGNGDAPS